MWIRMQYLSGRQCVDKLSVHSHRLQYNHYRQQLLDRGGAIILGSGTLVDNITGAAGALVLKSFPDDCLIEGVPARIIKTFDKEK